MAETALDLSINPSSSRFSDRVSTDSGRASADSAASEPLPHEDRLHPAVSVRARISPSAACVSTSPPALRLKTEGRSPSLNHYPPSTSEDEASGFGIGEQAENATKGNGGAERVAPFRPFKMYPMDSMSMYNPLLAGTAGSMPTAGGLGSPAGLHSLYDSPAVTASPAFNSFALTPLTSHLLQRKRRQEGRDRDKEASKSPSASSTAPPNDDDDSDSDSARRAAKLVPDEKKDEAYWERRRKNNEAAKRSRDARRQKEEEIAMRAAFLEQENLKLRAQVAILKNETAKLHYMLYNRL